MAQATYPTAETSIAPNYSLTESPDFKKRTESKNVNDPRSYNRPDEVEEMVASAGVKKSSNTLDKTIYLGFLAGLFVAIAGITSLVAASNFDPAFSSANPVVPKLIFSAIFPCGLFFIVLFGGDLFTGNTMILTVSYLHGQISVRDLLKNWIFVFLFNFVGCLFGAFFFGYLGEIFSSSSSISYIHHLVVTKANLPPGVAFVRAISANGLVCLAIFLGLTSRDVIGKLYGLWVPVFMFAMCGFEHCVANMFYFSMGLLLGAPVTAGQFATNIIVVTLGNIVGGAFLVGFSEYYLYHWQYTSHNHILEHNKYKAGLPAQVVMHREDSKTRKNVSEWFRNRFCPSWNEENKEGSIGAKEKDIEMSVNVCK